MKKSVFFSIATNIFQCWIFPWHLRFARCLDRRRLGPRNFWVKIEGPCVFCMNIFWWFGTWLLYGFYDFPSIGNGKSSQLTNSYFSDWNHQPVLIHFVILFRSQFRNICVLWVDLQEGISTATGFSKKARLMWQMSPDWKDNVIPEIPLPKYWFGSVPKTMEHCNINSRALFLSGKWMILV